MTVKHKKSKRVFIKKRARKPKKRGFVFPKERISSWRYQAVYVVYNGKEDELDREYSICEVYLDKDDKLEMWTENFRKGPYGSSFDSLIKDIQLMMDDVRKWKAVPFKSLKEGMVFERA